MIKRIIKYTIISFILVLSFWEFCIWLRSLNTWEYGELDGRFPYTGSQTNALDCTGNTDLWNCTSVKEDEKGRRWASNTIIRRLLWVFGLNADKWDDLKFIDYLRAILNIALW